MLQTTPIKLPLSQPQTHPILENKLETTEVKTQKKKKKSGKSKTPRKMSNIPLAHTSSVAGSPSVPAKVDPESDSNPSTFYSSLNLPHGSFFHSEEMGGEDAAGNVTSLVTSFPEDHDSDGEAVKTEERPDPLIWFPHRGEKNFYGNATEDYFQSLEEAIGDEANSLALLRAAHVHMCAMGCPRTSMIWKNLEPRLRIIEHNKLYEVGSQLATVLRYNYSNLSIFTRCFDSMAKMMKGPHDTVIDLESRLTSLAASIKTLDMSMRSRMDEVDKWNAQINTTADVLATFVEKADQIALKISNLDVLPSSKSYSATRFSVPESVPKKKTEKLPKIDLGESGVYTGPYTIQVDKGKIVSIIPPGSYEEISGLVNTNPAYQQVFINRDQRAVLNKLASYSEYRNAFHQAPGVERTNNLRNLVKGIGDGHFQWSRVESSAPPTISSGPSTSRG